MSNFFVRHLSYCGLLMSLCLLLSGDSLVLRLFLRVPPAEASPTQALANPFELVWSANEDENTYSLAWGDYDNDGDLDLAAGGNGVQPNRVYRNDGGRLPTTSTWASADYGSAGVAWVDVDGDGDLDLAADAKLYRNDGGQLTTLPIWSSTAGDNTSSIAWGDYDGDGDPDLAVGNLGPYDSTCNCFLGQPNRLYRNDEGILTNTPVWSSVESDATNSLAWGDYDSDGDLDLAVGNFDQPNRLYRNNNGLLTMDNAWAPSEVGLTYSVAWADYDGDGDLDLAAGIQGQPTRVYQNNGGAITNAPIWESTESDLTHGLAWGDYDSDGDLDLFVSNGGPSRLYRNDNGILTDSAIWSSSLTDPSISAAWGDYDNDGDLDLAVGNIGPDRLYRNDSGALLDEASWSSTDSGPTHSVAWGDYDSDGDLDVAVGNDGQPNKLYRNDNGALTDSAVWSASLADPTYSVAWGDYDNDGDLDLAIGNNGQPNRLYRNEGGSLNPTAVWSSSQAGYTMSIAWGDVDNDGDLDLAAGNFGQPNNIYLNVNGTLTANPVWWSAESDPTTSVAWGDYDNDGDLDLAVGNYDYGQPSKLYRNDGGLLTSEAVWGPIESSRTASVAWGDENGDGNLDLAVGTAVLEPIWLYRNNGGVLPSQASWSSVENYASVNIAWGDYDGDGDLDLAAGNSDDSPNQLYRNDNMELLNSAIWSAVEEDSTQALAWGDYDKDGDLDLFVGNKLQPNRLYRNMRDARLSLGVRPIVQIDAPTGVGADFYSSPMVLTGPVISITYTLSDPGDGTVSSIRAFYSFNGGGSWLPAVAASNAVTTNLSTTATYIYPWDLLASGFFGESDNVVFRIEAVPGITNKVNHIPGPYLYGTYASSTFPFRVRGTQIQVISGTQPISNTIVYRLPVGEDVGGGLIRGGTGAPFITDSGGYLQGRGVLQPGDRLLALAPVLTSTQGYALFYTNGTPQVVGLDTFTVTTGGVQTLTVSAQNPLYLFDLDVSLEWDAHNDPAYLDQLSFNLKRASQYLYDFTNGQMALGDVFIYQDTAAWSNSHIVIPAHNRLRPFAIIGGIVATDTVDSQHNTVTDTIRYAPGQVVIGSTWNRYGRPGQMLGDDWSVILAHELGHYLLYHDDVYLGFDPQGNLIPISSCTGSAMGDLYDRPANTEFIFDESLWQANCGQTLAEQLLERNEWETMDLWYPDLVTPTSVLSGPSIMPFDLTTITIFDPLTPTDTLADPTFYLNYENNAISSADARVYLFQSDAGGDWLIHQGSPIGGQNRAVARGAKPVDRLCVFDVSQSQFGCETVEFGDDQLQLKLDSTWNPVIRVTPVNSQTLNVQVSNMPTTGITLEARVFPDLYYAPPVITLDLVDNSYYSGTFVLTETGVINGNVQVWVDEPASETNPRRESMVAYTIGGNPGGPPEGGGGTIRGNGGIGTIRGNGGIGTIRGNGGIGTIRGNGGIGTIRGNGGIGGMRSEHAPLLSPDGQLIYFTQGNTEFLTGTLFAIQSLASVPDLPPGRTLVGQGYALVASPGAVLPAGSVSVQYLSNDVTAVGAQEEQVSVYVYTSTTTGWVELPTTRDSYFDVVVAESQGPGLYALLASVQIPLPVLGWNQIGYPVWEAQPITNVLTSIANQYTLAYHYVLTDTNDPWKVYAPGLPDYVMDLHEMQFGGLYWIYATVTTTLYIAPQPQSLAEIRLYPPTTFYGAVNGSGDFTPQAGMPVEARINDVVCGHGQTRDYGGEVVYVVKVEAEVAGQWAGCGQVGRAVAFYVNGQPMSALGTWDNAHAIQLPLHPGFQVYLPLVHFYNIPPVPPGCTLYTSADVPKSIPDNLSIGVVSTVLIPGAGINIVDLSLRLDSLQHSYDGDLQISLIAPDGTEVLLVDRVGREGDNFISTRLNDAALMPVVLGVAPFAGNYQPDGPLSTFRDKNSAGTWKLRVADRAPSDTGVVVAWSLEVCDQLPSADANNQALPAMPRIERWVALGGLKRRKIYALID